MAILFMFEPKDVLDNKDFNTICEVIKTGNKEDLDAFKIEREEPLKEEFVNNDESLQRAQKEVSEHEANVQKHDTELKHHEESKAIVLKLNKQIDEIAKGDERLKRKLIDAVENLAYGEDGAGTRKLDSIKKDKTFGQKMLAKIGINKKDKQIDTLATFVKTEEFQRRFDKDTTFRYSVTDLAKAENPTDRIDDKIKEATEDKQKSQEFVDYFKDNHEKIHARLTKEFYEKITKENQTIDSFVGIVRDIDAMTPPKVETMLENAGALNEPVSFNLTFASHSKRTTASRLADVQVVSEAGTDLKNAFKMMGVELTDDTNSGKDPSKWYLRKQGGNTSDSGRFEVYSPFMDVKNNDMARLMAGLEKMGITTLSPAIPLKQKDILLDIPDKEKSLNEAKSILGTTADGHLDATALVMEAREKGFKHGPYASLPELEAKYSNQEKVQYLFQGTMVSDEKFVLSKRAGRTGMGYATPNFNYAKGYCGAASGGSQSATGDNYIDTTVYDSDGNKHTIGFVNIYKASEKNRYFDNFGIEDGCKDNKALSEEQSRTHALAETLVNDENNLVGRIVVVDNNHFYEYDRNDPKWKAFEEIRKADVRDTYDNKPEILNRNRAQHEEKRENGHVVVHSLNLPKIMSSNFDREPEKMNAQQKQSAAKTILIARGMRNAPVKHNKPNPANANQIKYDYTRHVGKEH